MSLYFAGSAIGKGIYRSGSQAVGSRARYGLKVAGAGGKGLVPSLVLSGSSFSAGAAQNTAIGNLSVVGGTGTYTFTLTNSAGSKVQVAGVNGVNLQVGATAASVGSFIITVHATNGAGSTFDRNASITAISGTFVPTYYLLGF